MADVKKRPVLLTPKFRVAFPQIENAMVFVAGAGKPRIAGPGEKGRFSVVALFRPTEFSEGDKLKWSALIAACNRVSNDTFKKPMKELDRGLYKTPFHRGEEKKDYAGYGEGVVFCSLTAVRKPGLLNLDGERITADEIYPGCYVRASVNPFAYNNVGKGIAIGLNNVKKLAEGERLDGATSAEEDFGSDPEEYAADDGADAAEEEVAF